MENNADRMPDRKELVRERAEILIVSIFRGIHIQSLIGTRDEFCRRTDRGEMRKFCCFFVMFWS